MFRGCQNAPPPLGTLKCQTSSPSSGSQAAPGPLKNHPTQFQPLPVLPWWSQPPKPPPLAHLVIPWPRPLPKNAGSPQTFQKYDFPKKLEPSPEMGTPPKKGTFHKREPSPHMPTPLGRAGQFWGKTRWFWGFLGDLTETGERKGGRGGDGGWREGAEPSAAAPLINAAH